MAIVHAEEETRKLVALLGGAKVFPRKIKNAKDFQEALRAGFPYASFEALVAALELSSKDLAQILGLAVRTLARRKTSQQFSPVESDRLYRVARATLQASIVLGSLEKGRAWLHSANQALGGEPPVALLDTEIGERQVEELLNRISYGILS